MKHPIAVAFALVAASGTLLAQSSGSWAGPYVGGSLGYGWGKGDTRFYGLPNPATFDMKVTTIDSKPHGFLLGPQLGYNWQKGRTLYGVEGDLAWSNIDGSKTTSPLYLYNGTPWVGGGHLRAGQDIDWLATLRGRIGFVPTGKWFPYFTAGVAFAGINYSTKMDEIPSNASTWSTSFSKRKSGWTVGLGAEWAMSDKWSAKAEYLFADLGHQSRVLHPTAPATMDLKNTWKTKLNIVRLGANYRFGGPKPVVAPPPPPPPPVEEVKPVAPPPPPPPPPPAPEVKPVVVAPPPPPPPPQKIVLDQAVLHFANAKNELSEEGVLAIQQVAQELMKYPGEYTLLVSGHTSSTGSKAFNKALSKRRADAVAKVLADSGIPAASIQTVGVGPDQPIADNATPEGQARNRRVEIEVKVKDATVETRTIQTQTQDTPAPKKKVIKKK